MFGKPRIVTMCLVLLAVAAPASAQHYVEPLKGQSPEQQKQDEARCFTWAMQQSGFDPANPWLAPQASAPTSTAGSVLVRSGANGAVAGAMTRRDAGDAAVAGAIVVASAQPQPATTTAAVAIKHGDVGAAVIAGGNSAPSTQPAANAAAAAILGSDPGSVTAGGAVAGATVRRDAVQPIALQQQASSQQQLAGEASFQKARGECLEAHGYTVQ
jgi:hypothetical protein